MARAKTPTSATGISTSSGFTLLEVMVTVVLIGIIASFAVLAIRGDDPGERLTREARRLHARLELGHQEAILRGEQRGVLFTRSGYAFVVETDQNQWGLPVDSSISSSYSLPRGLQMTLTIDERRVALAETAGSTLQPQVLLLANGELTPFLIILSSTANRDTAYGIAGDIAGRLQFEAVQPLNPL